MNAVIKRRQIPAGAPAPDFSSATSTLLQKIFCHRGLYSDEDIALGLNGLLSPQLKGLEEAVAIVKDSLFNHTRVLIVGDFDADGATSCAVLTRGLEAMGHSNVRFIVPNRFEFGYGLTPEIVDIAKPLAPDVIVTVDNGISSIQGVLAAKQAGIKVVVTDHHLPGDELPAADAIVNPNQSGCEFASKNLAGVGVVFYLLLALRAALREENYFSVERPEPNLAELLDLVALGTVADVVPLDKNNRILVEQGLRRIRAGKACVGIKALLQIAGRNAANLTASDLGFVLGPRLNAAGRLDDISIGIAVLLTDDLSLACDIAQELDNLNKDRRTIEQGMKREAEKLLDTLHQEMLPVGVCLYEAGWHQGIVGILASRIKEKHHRPTICFAPASDDPDCNELKGSARSIPGLHIRDALDLVASHNPGLIQKFGGHAMAAGLSLEKNKFKQFCQVFDSTVQSLLSEEQLEKQLLSDGDLHADDLTLATAQVVKREFPWGQGVPEPLFDGEFQLVQQRIVGGSHLKMVLAKKDQPQTQYDAIAFYIDIERWPDSAVQRVHVAYSLDVNEFRGQRSLQLLVRQIEKID